MRRRGFIVLGVRAQRRDRAWHIFILELAIVSLVACCSFSAISFAEDAREIPNYKELIYSAVRTSFVDPPVSWHGGNFTLASHSGSTIRELDGLLKDND
jgi:hypothetical protein